MGKLPATDLTDAVAVEDQGIFRDDSMQLDRVAARSFDMQSDFSTDNITDFFTTIDITTPEGEDKLLALMSDPDKRLKAAVNQTITIQDVYCEVVELESRTKPGETEPAPRIVILAADGTSYGCTSFGVYQMLRRMVRIKKERFRGTKVQIVTADTQKGNSVLTLKIVQ